MMKMHYYKAILRVRNEVGVLARITILIRKFQINIRSLDVAPIDDEEKFSDIHVTFETQKDEVVSIVMKKLARLVPVVSVDLLKQ